MNGKNLKYFVLGAAIVAAGLSALAVTIPNSFSSGQVISAAGLNANFAALKTAVDALETKVTALEAPKSVTLEFPGGALNTTLTQGFAGPTYLSAISTARLAIKRPADWSSNTSITVELYFTPTTAGTGTAGFFIRPRRYNPGDSFQDQTGIVSTLQSVTETKQFLKQTITIPATQLGKELWELVVQRSGDGTFGGEIELTSVALTYTTNP